MSQGLQVISAYKRFSLFSLALVVVVVVVVVALRFSSKQNILNFRVTAVRDKELRTRETYTYLLIFSPFRSQSIGKSAYVNAFCSVPIISRLDSQSKFQMFVYTIFQPQYWCTGPCKFLQNISTNILKVKSTIWPILYPSLVNELPQRLIQLICSFIRCHGVCSNIRTLSWFLLSQIYNLKDIETTSSNAIN